MTDEEMIEHLKSKGYTIKEPKRKKEPAVDFNGWYEDEITDWIFRSNPESVFYNPLT